MRGFWAVLAFLPALGLGQTIPTPKSFLGFEVCQDYHLASYKQLTEYWRMLDKASDRVEMVSMGKTEFGRDQYMLVISSPSNIRNREALRKRSETIARAKAHKTEADARAYIKDSKAVVWIDGGLHATETLCPQMLIQQAYELASRNDEEIKRILDNVIVLLVHANPDGMDLVSDWYMRRANPTTRELSGVPELYQKYCGHDNNRDFYALNMKESQNMSKQLYTVWYPQIMYNHHQSSPAGTIMFIPPFRNPFNFHVDPLIQVATDTVGMHMHQRLISEGKSGTVMRNGAGFSTWWNGGLRTTTYFHNMVGILTETWGNPTPSRVPFLKPRQVPTIDIPMPVDAGPWHLKQSLDYSLSANYAILDYAARYREPVMYNVWRSARNAIERGSRDSWTRYPSRIEQFGEEALKRSDFRDARLYVVPSDQPDFKNAALFMKKLALSGVEVEQLTREQFLGKKSFPVGSFVLRCDQAYRPHIMDMFEPQDYPNDFQYPGGPPNPPYDNAGYTLAYQMGVQFDRILDPITMETKPADIESVLNKSGIKGNTGSAQWFVASPESLDAYSAANRLMAQGLPVLRVKPGVPQDREPVPPRGSFVIRASGLSQDQRSKIAASGEWTTFDGPIMPGTLETLRKPRIGLVDRYGGSMPSGWTRYALEQYGYPFEVIFAPDIDKGSLRQRFDVILVPSGFSLAATSSRNPLMDDPTVPQHFKDRMGSLTQSASLGGLKQFVEEGGHLILVGTSARIGESLGLPIQPALVEKDASGKTVNLPESKFFIPASVLRLSIDMESPLTVGLAESIDVMFDDNPSYQLQDGASSATQRIGWFEKANLLRSGWAWGQTYLQGTTSLIDHKMGQGQVVLYCPEVTFRAQPTGTFRLVFNAIVRASATPTER